VCVPESASVLDAVRLMQERRIGAVAVVDRTGRLAGIFTERDVLTKVAGKPGDPARTPVSQQMTRSPVALRETAEIGFALNKMCLGGYRHIPLVDVGGKPIGILSMRDVAHFLVEFFPEDVVNLPPAPPAAADEPDGG
jgi:CBS domain-containing protein